MPRRMATVEVKANGSHSDFNILIIIKRYMHIHYRKKRFNHLYYQCATIESDIFGYPASRSMYSEIPCSKIIVNPENNSEKTVITQQKEIHDTLEEDYRAAAIRLAPFLPLQLSIPAIKYSRKPQTRRRDWWATQKRRRYWRRNPTRKRFAYHRRRTFRHKQ